MPGQLGMSAVEVIRCFKLLAQATYADEEFVMVLAQLLIHPLRQRKVLCVLSNQESL